MKHVLKADEGPNEDDDGKKTEDENKELKQQDRNRQVWITEEVVDVGPQRPLAVPVPYIPDSFSTCICKFISIMKTVCSKNSSYKTTTWPMNKSQQDVELYIIICISLSKS